MDGKYYYLDNIRIKAYMTRCNLSNWILKKALVVIPTKGSGILLELAIAKNVSHETRYSGSLHSECLKKKCSIERY